MVCSHFGQNSMNLSSGIFPGTHLLPARQRPGSKKTSPAIHGGSTGWVPLLEDMVEEVAGTLALGVGEEL